LWRSDGTAEGTILLKGNLEDPYGWYIQHPSLYLFTDYTAEHGTELWRSDGTAEGTVMVKDINPGSESGNPNPIARHNNTIYFGATTAAEGNELWRTDGTAAGTTLVKDMKPGPDSSYPNEGIIFNNILYLSVTSGTDATLWRSDGTAAGTTEMLSTLIEPSYFTVVGNQFFFTPFHPDYGRELWVSDGTVAGTSLVKDIRVGTVGSFSHSFNVLNDKLYFTTNDNIHGYELWETDGTEAGTNMVKDIYPGGMTGILGDISTGHGRLYLGANEGIHGLELWQSDGTDAGTIRLTDINPGSDDSGPTNWQFVGDRLFFSAHNGSTTDLWAVADPQEGPTFTVNNRTDTNNGVCTLGHCSLREAILAANAQAGPNTIAFAPTGQGMISPATALPAITEALHINGPGVSFLTLNGALVTHNSLLWVSSGSLMMNGLTIWQGGSNNTPNGGALQAQAPVTLSDLRFDGNRATLGGAVTLYSGGTLTNVEFTDNHASEGNAGALAAYNGTVTITNSRFSNNTAAQNGGAIFMQGNFLNIYTSEFYGNQAANGGAIYAEVRPTIERTSFVSNHATADGGAIYATSSGATDLSNLLMVDNTAAGLGNAFYLGGGSPGLTHHLLHATIAGTGQVAGTAVQMAAGGTLHVTNSIITNQSTGLGRTNGTLNEDYNLFHGNATNHTGITGGANSLVGNPHFLSAENAFYQLLPTSPAVDAGTATDVTVDYNNRPRPQGSAPDIGFSELAQTAVSGPGFYDIGGTGVAITVTQAGDLANVQLVWVPFDHPSYDEESEENHPASRGGYWTILGVNSNGETATDFSLTLTLPHYNEPNPSVCRWDGAEWDCGRDGFTSTHVWRHNVTAFSDWAIGEYQAPPVSGHTLYLPLITR
jgi:CSLREA domain-containing protein